MDFVIEMAKAANVNEVQDIQSAILNILNPIFGDSVKSMIVHYYDSSQPQELLDLAHHLLAGYMDEKVAEAKLRKVMEKFPAIRAAVGYKWAE